VLAALGALMGPQWSPFPMSDPLQVQSSATAIGGAPAAHVYPVTQRVVTVQLDGATVRAQISEPVGVSGPVAAVVFVHGAGTGSFEEAFTAQARALAASGVVTMVPDKRLDTYSLRHRDYEQMADDYEASVAYLRTQDGVDPARVGVYAESEGAWIAPVMVARDPGIAFLLLISAPVVPPRQQAAFATDSYLRNTGAPSGLFRAIPRAVGMSLPGGGFEYADFDVSSYQRQVRVPVFVAYGTADASMPMVQGAEQIIRDTAIAGNSDYTIRYYAGASHGLRVDDAIVPDFLRDMTGWVGGLPGTAHAYPRIAGEQPQQLYWATPVPTPRWLGDGARLLLAVEVAAGLVALAGLGWLVRTGVRRVRRPPSTPGPAGAPGRPGPRGGAGRRAAALGWLALLTVGALVFYLVAVARLALGYERNVWIVQGGWVAVRLLGIAAVVAGVSLVDRVRSARAAHEPAAVGPGAVVFVWANVLGGVVLLVVLAYWGVYQLGI